MLGSCAARRSGTTPPCPASQPGYVPFLVLLGRRPGRQRDPHLAAARRGTGGGTGGGDAARPWTASGPGIARELHDVVTHNVERDGHPGRRRPQGHGHGPRAGPGGAARGRGRRPGRDDRAAARHGAADRERTTDARTDLAPQPGLDQLAALVARVRDTGVPVDLAVDRHAGRCRAGVDLAAYRVVQEALTNTVKHAAGARVRSPSTTAAEPAGRGRRHRRDCRPPRRAGNGRGLTGLRERLAVYGGTLHAGPRPTGGYRVRAVIPVGDRREPSAARRDRRRPGAGPHRVPDDPRRRRDRRGRRGRRRREAVDAVRRTRPTWC